MTIDTITRGGSEPASTEGHLTTLLVPVRSGEMRKVSARCSCGWRAVGIARELHDADAAARAKASAHVIAAAVDPEHGEPEVEVPTRSGGPGFATFLVAAVVMAVLLAGGLELMWGVLSGGGVELTSGR